MNVVQVKLVEDKGEKRYTYQVPDSMQFLKGNVVHTKNMNGVASSIIGIYTLDLFSANSKE